ncbi:MAG: glycine zipper family protein, partial [Syntrophobacteraceae bacterium CG23_combo_of_CG06-09_8_20_14_all_50_8]
EEAYTNRDQALDVQYEGKARDFRRAMSACLEGRGYSVK